MAGGPAGVALPSGGLRVVPRLGPPESTAAYGGAHVLRRSGHLTVSGLNLHPQ